MTVFDTFDAGFSQTRGLTLFELTKAQLEKLNYLSAIEAKEVNSDVPNESLLLMEEIPTTIEEALRCLDHEIEGSHGRKALEKLLNIKRQLLY